MKKLEVVEDAREGSKWWSVRLWIAAIVCQGLAQALPLWSDLVSPEVLTTVGALLGTAGLVARFIKQEIDNGSNS